MLPTFSEITQAWQCLGLYGQMSSHTKFQLQIMLLTLDIDPTTPNKNVCHTPQNQTPHSEH